jgi:phage terminase large subunit GpA-like protein
MSLQTLFDTQGADPLNFFLEDLVYQASEAIQPSERLNVHQAAAKYRKLPSVGAGAGLWRNEVTPYLEEPMEEMTNRLFESVVFVGPAQCGKTDMFLNYLVYSVRCDPADLTLVQTTNVTARQFSISRLDRMHILNPELKEKLVKDNVFDKQYSNGMFVYMSWPSINELSGKPLPRVWLTDYDRMDMNVDDEGTPFVLAKARSTAFKTYGKTIAESSPGFVVLDAQWQRRPEFPHEAPPCEGILALYNAGDRRRWYWKCVGCDMSFEPNWNLITYPVTADPLEAGEAAVMNCPWCGQIYTHEPTRHSPGKQQMNQLHKYGGQARWLKEGEIWEGDEVRGHARRSNSASFALEGVCAAFNSWKQIVTDFVNAEKEFSDTGKEDTLKSVVNTKIGRAYLPKAQASARMAETLKNRSRPLGRRVVPHGVRFLIATIDVQQNRFEVQVHGVGIEDVWIIDRFQIRYSKRPDPARQSQFLPLDPKGHPEDWRQILTEVMERGYPLIDDPDLHMGIHHTFCDSAGGEGVTSNAYDFYRWLVRGYEENVTDEIKRLYPWKSGFSTRFRLTKGDPTPAAPSIRVGFPDSQRKDRMAGARGEIPVIFINTTILKNKVDSVLERVEAGGRINFPDWLELWWYQELVVETKNKEGKWENLTGRRNESWDLLVYLYAGLLYPGVAWLNIAWDRPPDWAAEWNANSMVYSIKGPATPFTEKPDPYEDLEALGRSMN